MAKADSLWAAGAEPVLADALDAEALAAAVVLARPDLVIHQLTSLPSTPDPRRHAAAYAQTAQLHTQGIRNLLRAAAAAGVRRVIAHSVAFGYAPGIGPATEEEALLAGGPKTLRATIAAVVDLERQVMHAAGLQGVVLRYGHLYGPGTWYALTAPSPSRSASAGSRSSGTGRAASPSSMSPTPPARPWPPLARPRPAPTTWWTTTRPRSASGCPGTPRPFRPRRPGTCPRFWPAWPPATRPCSSAPASAAPATSEPASTSGWRPRYGSWRAGFAATSSGADHRGLLDVAG
jgi:hypothetical protein